MSLAGLSPTDKRKWRLPQSAIGTPDDGWIHPQTSIGDDVRLGDGVVINKPSLIRSGVSLNRVVCSTATDLTESLDHAIAYQERGVTHHIALR